MLSARNTDLVLSEFSGWGACNHIESKKRIWWKYKSWPTYDIEMISSEEMSGMFQ